MESESSRLRLAPSFKIVLLYTGKLTISVLLVILIALFVKFDGNLDLVRARVDDRIEFAAVFVGSIFFLVYFLSSFWSLTIEPGKVSGRSRFGRKVSIAADSIECIDVQTNYRFSRWRILHIDAKSSIDFYPTFVDLDEKRIAAIELFGDDNELSRRLFANAA